MSKHLIHVAPEAGVQPSQGEAKFTPGKILANYSLSCWMPARHLSRGQLYA